MDNTAWFKNAKFDSYDQKQIEQGGCRRRFKARLICALIFS
jgi:hypothetical protein